MACNLVGHDHLHVALACLYCSTNNSPKMQWYSATTWEQHTHKHVQDNLLIHPDDPAFCEQFGEISTFSSVSKLTSTLPPSINICERAKAAKDFLAEDNEESTFPFQDTQTPMSPRLQNVALNKVPSSLARKSRQPNTKIAVSRYS